MKNIVVYYKSRFLCKEIRETITVLDCNVLESKLDVLRRYLDIICPYVNYQIVKDSLTFDDSRYENGMLCNALERLIENEVEFVNDYVCVDKIEFEISVEDDHYIQLEFSDSEDDNIRKKSIISLSPNKK